MDSVAGGQGINKANRMGAATMVVRVPIGLLLATLALVAAVPPVAPQQAGLNEVALSAIAYHPHPDPEGDPFGFASAFTPNATRDWMAAYYDGYWFPTVAFDGIDIAANLPDGTDTGFLDAYRERLVKRLREDAPATISIMGRANASGGFLQVHVDPQATIDGGRILLRTVLFEDDIEFTGKNGVETHRFTARHQFPEREITLRAGEGIGPVNLTFEIPQTASGAPVWAPGRLGAVAYLQTDVPPDAGGIRAREVLQSATYSFRQDGPTIQTSKAVLLEMYTATWCEACVFGDGALDLLASEYGIASSLAPKGGFAYLQMPSPLAFLAIIPLAAIASWILLPRTRPPPGTDGTRGGGT